MKINNNPNNIPNLKYKPSRAAFQPPAYHRDREYKFHANALLLQAFTIILFVSLIQSRYVVHNTDWTVIGTISANPNITGKPFTNIMSFCDGPMENSTGFLL